MRSASPDSFGPLAGDLDRKRLLLLDGQRVVVGLLGRMPDVDVAARIGKSQVAVRVHRVRQRIEPRPPRKIVYRINNLPGFRSWHS